MGIAVDEILLVQNDIGDLQLVGFIVVHVGIAIVSPFPSPLLIIVLVHQQRSVLSFGTVNQSSI